ncbi:MAG: hypothetical protein HC850_09650 [Rhodomicrobium sp.]|nr:hypothetical protein [Rhodomicrobium sp.]
MFPHRRAASSTHVRTAHEKVYVPWTLPGTFNGRHPLVASLIDGPSPAAEFLQPLPRFGHDDVTRTVKEFTAFTAR